jgi:hypothetical protein
MVPAPRVPLKWIAGNAHRALAEGTRREMAVKVPKRAPPGAPREGKTPWSP